MEKELSVSMLDMAFPEPKGKAPKDFHLSRGASWEGVSVLNLILSPDFSEFLLSNLSNYLLLETLYLIHKD